MRQSRPIRVIFFGTPAFSIPSLKALAEDERFSIIEVVTRQDERSGRGMRIVSPPIKEVALGLNSPVYQPTSLSDRTVLEHLKGLKAEMFVVVAYGRILPPSILSLPQRGVLNVHPSLLPRYRGPSPIQTALRNGDATTGVSIILLNDGPVDGGPILDQKPCDIPERATYESLSLLLALEAARMLPDALAQYLSGNITPRQQNDGLASTTSLITRADGAIDTALSAKEIERQVRAFTPWPGAYLSFRGKRMKILSAHVTNETLVGPPGSIVLHNKMPHLICGAGSLTLDTVQLEGKSPLAGKDFASGYLKD